VGLTKRIDVDATYWRVLSLSMDWDGLTAETLLAAYEDEEARRRGDPPVATRSYSIDLLAILSAPIQVSSLMDVGSVVYAIVKMHPDFHGSGDVIEPDQVVVEVDPFAEPPIWNSPSDESPFNPTASAVGVCQE